MKWLILLLQEAQFHKAVKQKILLIKKLVGNQSQQL